MTTCIASCAVLWRRLVAVVVCMVLATYAVATDGEGALRYWQVWPVAFSPEVHFMPTDTMVYTSPVLVVLTGLQPHDEALMFKDDALIGVPYTGPFWLHQTARLTAVINGRDMLTATYTLHVPPAPVVRIYPPTGTFIGGVSVLVYQSSEDAEYVWCVNRTRCTALTHFVVTLRTAGLQTITVRATFRGGLCSEATTQYIIYAATPPQLTPAATAVYYNAIAVQCHDPLARPLALRVDERTDGAATTQHSNEDATHVSLDAPGRYVLSCGYTDDLHVFHGVRVSYVLEARVLPPPSFDPPCHAIFPYAPLLLSLRRIAQHESTHGSAAPTLLSSSADGRWRVMGNVTGGTLQFIVRASDAQYDYAVLPPPPPSFAGNDTARDSTIRLRVQMWTVADNIFECDSPPHSCDYQLLPFDAAYRSAFFSVLPRCPTTTTLRGDEPHVTSSCLHSIVANLGHCLHLYLPDRIAALRVGPMVLLTLTGLDLPRYGTYDEPIVRCLSRQNHPFITAVHAEAQDGFELATSWRVISTATASTLPDKLPSVSQSAFHVWGGLPILIEVRGFGLRRHEFYLVRHAYGCDDVGVAATQAVHDVDAATDVTRRAARAQSDDWARDVWDETRAAALLSDAWQERVALLFTTMPSAGRYKLCARRVASNATERDVVYTVPARSLRLHIHTAPAPQLHVDDAVHDRKGTKGCGGALDRRYARRAVALNVVATVVAPPQYTHYAYTTSGSPWRTVAFDPRTQSSQLAVDHASDTAVSVSLGATTTATETCVFYDAGVEASQRGPLRYDFHSLGTGHRLSAAVPAGESIDAHANRTEAVMAVLTLHGEFSAEELLVVQVHTSPHCAFATRELLDGASSHGATMLLASVEARSSAALLNYSMAVSDHAVRLPLVGDGTECAMTVHVLRDGQAVRSAVAAARVVLSPLSLAMWRCTRCRSGYCVTRNQVRTARDGSDEACVCIGQTNKTAYLCGADEDGGGGGGGSGGDDTTLPPTPTSERVWIMISYIVILVAIAAGIFIAIRYNARMARARALSGRDEGTTMACAG